MNSEITTTEIHGFCDASERALGACVCVRSGNASGNLDSQLLCSKSRVSPVKQVSIPRLELCGTQLLARLIKKVLPILCMPVDSVHLWTDSRLVLIWLQGHPRRWNTYIANRVRNSGYYIKFYLASCGIGEQSSRCSVKRNNPEELRHNGQWWNGPSWLAQGEEL
jgi:hypothetical protein